MKYRLLEILCCPECGKDLKLDVFKSEPRQAVDLPSFPSVRCRQWCARTATPPDRVKVEHCISCYATEIVEGVLECRCGNVYPIIGGIPRILPKKLLLETLANYHKSFLRQHSERLRIHGASEVHSKEKIDTLHAFSYQWTTFVANFEYFRNIFLSFVRPFLEPRDFQNRLVLEVGCGSGRPASVASSFGAEVVAIDLSESVRTAHSMTKLYPMLHVVQGDAYSLPFKPCFDFVYSVGVIQHLPAPDLAIRSISKVVPSGHRLVIWVYGIREFWYKPIDWLRKVTVNLPFPILHGLSVVLALLSEILLLIPYRILSRIPSTGKFSQRIPGRIYANFPFKENILGWFDRLGAPVTHYFTKDDVERMLIDSNFGNIRIVARPGASASWIAEATKHDV